MSKVNVTWCMHDIMKPSRDWKNAENYDLWIEIITKIVKPRGME